MEKCWQKCLTKRRRENNVYQSNHVFLGATDNVEEGVWKWLDGSSLTYENWIAGKPDNQGAGENYLIYQSVYGEDGEDELNVYVNASRTKERILIYMELQNDVRDDYYLEQAEDSHFDLVYIYGIAEIKLNPNEEIMPTPEPEPEPTPELTPEPEPIPDPIEDEVTVTAIYMVIIKRVIYIK